MNKKLLNSNDKYLFFIIPIIVTLFCLVLNICRYSVIDDISMLKIAESYRTNSHSEFLVFISVIFGYILKFLYNLMPFLCWYSVLHIFFITLSFIIINSTVKKSKNYISAYIFLSVFQIVFLTNITFSNVAFLVAVSAFLLVLFNVKEINKQGVLIIICAAVLFVFAFSFRHGQTLYGVLLLILPVLFFSFIKKRNAFSVIAITLVLCITANYTVMFIQKEYVSKIPDESYYSEFQEYRSQASDGGLFNYEANRDELLNAGISENDYLLFKQWLQTDKTVFNNSAVKAIAESRNLDEKFQLNIKGYLTDVLHSRYSLMFMMISFFVALVGFIAYKKRRLEIFITYFFSAMSVGYLFFRRRPAEKLIISILSCECIILITEFINFFNEHDLIPRFSSITKKINKPILFGCIISLILSMGFVLYTEQTYIRFYERQSKIVDYIDGLSDDYIVISDVTCFNNYKKYNHSFNILKSDWDDGSYYSVLGDWYIYSYYWYDYLENNGFYEYKDSTFFALINDNTLFVSSVVLPEEIVTFFDENYNTSISYEEISVPDFVENEDIHIYRFSKIM